MAVICARRGATERRFEIRHTPRFGFVLLSCRFCGQVSSCNEDLSIATPIMQSCLGVQTYHGCEALVCSGVIAGPPPHYHALFEGFHKIALTNCYFFLIRHPSCMAHICQWVSFLILEQMSHIAHVRMSNRDSNFFPILLAVCCDLLFGGLQTRRCVFLHGG